MRAVIVGGSIGGLFAALGLRRAGWDVEVHERAEPELSGRGAGISTHPQIIACLRALDLPTGDLGVAVAVRHLFASDGRVVAKRARPQIMTSWDRLFAMLRGALPPESYRRGREFVRAEPYAHGAVARFADGSSVAADLLIGADGLRSAVRAQFLPAVVPSYAGYVAWRGLAAEHALPETTRRALFGCMAFALPPGEQILGYPVAGPGDDLREGHRRYNVVWYRPADAVALRRLLTDDAGRYHALSIPPPLVPAAAVAALHMAADAVLPPAFREVMRLSERPFLQPIYDLESPRMVFGRIAIIGDAAFVARPHVGAGVSKVAQDAEALARALAQESDIDAALHRFEAERRAAGQRIVAQGRDLGAALQSVLATDRERVMAARYREPDALLTDTASLDFLAGPDGAAP